MDRDITIKISFGADPDERPRATVATDRHGDRPIPEGTGGTTGRISGGAGTRPTPDAAVGSGDAAAGDVPPTPRPLAELRGAAQDPAAAPRPDPQVSHGEGGAAAPMPTPLAELTADAPKAKPRKRGSSGGRKKT